MGLLNFRVSSHMNIILLCCLCRAAFDDFFNPGVVFSPKDLDYFIRFEFIDRQRILLPPAPGKFPQPRCIWALIILWGWIMIQNEDTLEQAFQWRAATFSSTHGDDDVPASQGGLSTYYPWHLVPHELLSCFYCSTFSGYRSGMRRPSRAPWNDQLDQ